MLVKALVKAISLLFKPLLRIQMCAPSFSFLESSVKTIVTVSLTMRVLLL